MDLYRILMMPRFAADLEKIHDFIAQTSPGNASRVVKRVMDAAEKLAETPHRKVALLKDARLRHPVRTVPVSSYVIYFDIIEKEKVVRLLHLRQGARLPPTDL